MHVDIFVSNGFGRLTRHHCQDNRSNYNLQIILPVENLISRELTHELVLLVAIKQRKKTGHGL